MMSKYIPLIVVITLLSVTARVVTQNVPRTSDSDAAKPVNQSGDVRHSVRPRHRRQAQKVEKVIPGIIYFHNKFRAREGAANMEGMSWSKWLETLAATWAAKCEWKRGQPLLGKDPEFDKVGQNLYALAKVPPETQLNMKDVIQSWYDEKPNYSYETMKCAAGKTCDNYIQLVWAATRQVGCAVHICEPVKDGPTDTAQAFFVVCQYGPAANLEGAKPFINGTACSQCSDSSKWCKGNLCDSECSSSGDGCTCEAPCYNCGTVNESSCTCECADGWSGVDCSLAADGTVVKGDCPSANGTDNGNPASTKLTKSHHVMVMMMMFVMIIITAIISNLDAAS